MSRLPALLLAAAVAAMPALALAQTPAPNGAAEVNKRVTNQQQKTNQALSNGQLTQQQANRANKADARIANQSAKMQAKNPDGQLTAGQTKRLNTELNANRKVATQQQKRNAPAATQ